MNRSQGGSTGRIRTKYVYEAVLEVARRYKTKKEFRDEHHAMQQAVGLRGWWKRLEKDLGWPKHIAHVWTKERCLESANKFKYLSDWAVGCASSYQAAKRSGWFSEIKETLFHKKKPVKKRWDYQNCLQRALNFSSMSEWQYGCKDGSYSSARRKKWLGVIKKELFYRQSI